METKCHNHPYEMDAPRDGSSSEATGLLQKVISSILNDDGFSLPTDECKRCVAIANSLNKLFQQPLPSYRSHAKWLADQLNKLVDNAKKRGSKLINEEKLWSTFHKLCTSVSFQ